MAGDNQSSLQQRFADAVESFDGTPASREDVDKVLGRLGKHLGISSLSLNEDGVAQIRVDGEFDLLFLFASHLPGLLVCVPIEGVPKDESPLLKTMLQGNMKWTATRGGTFSLVPGTEQPGLFWLLLTKDGDITRMDREISEMVACARIWRDVFAKAGKTSFDPPDFDVDDKMIIRA